MNTDEALDVFLLFIGQGYTVRGALSETRDLGYSLEEVTQQELTALAVEYIKDTEERDEHVLEAS